MPIRTSVVLFVVIQTAVFLLFAALAIVVPKSKTSDHTEGKTETDDRLDSMLLLLWLPLAPLLVYWVSQLPGLHHAAANEGLFQRPLIPWLVSVVFSSLIHCNE